MFRCFLAIAVVGLMGRSVVRGQEPEATVHRALEWIAEQQLVDGSWAFNNDLDAAANSCRMSATALCILSFRSAGQSHRQGKFKNVIERGRGYLAGEGRWTDDGAVDLSGDAGDMRAHAWTTLALVQLGDYSKDRDPECLRLAQLAVNFAAEQQVAAGGWRRSPTAGSNMDATGWMLVALMAARRAGLQVDAEIVKRANGFLDSVQSDDGAAYGQSLPGEQPLATALGLLGRSHIAPLENPHHLRGVKQLSERGPDPRDAEYNFVVTLLMCQRGGEFAKNWHKPIREHVVKTQKKQGDNKGSWQDKQPAGFELDGTGLPTKADFGPRSGMSLRSKPIIGTSI